MPITVLCQMAKMTSWLLQEGDGQAKDSNVIELEEDHAEAGETEGVSSCFKSVQEGIKIKVCLT